MKIRNDKDRVEKEVALNDVVWIAGTKYLVYGFTGSSIKVEASGRVPAGMKQRDFINLNTFAKNYFFNGASWNYLVVARMPNMDYL